MALRLTTSLLTSCECSKFTAKSTNCSDEKEQCKAILLDQVGGLRLAQGGQLLSSQFQQSIFPLRRNLATKATKEISFSVSASAVPAKKVLIVNTNSGGHAILGYYLSRDLARAGHSVTIVTVGDERDAKMLKPPFKNFDELRSLGVKTVWGDPTNLKALIGSLTFDTILDNNGKDLATVKPVIDYARSAKAKKFIFISSAGIYKSVDETPHVEGDAINEASGHAEVERQLARVFDNWTSFRPQYITGAGNNKDCEEWFFDRLVRGRPVPVPGSGMQLTNVAHAADLSRMIQLAIEKPGLSRNSIFNLVSQRCVPLSGFVKMCAKAAGVKENIVLYDPAAVGVDVKEAFPFRPVHFCAEPRAAQKKLGWAQEVDLQEALNARFVDYLASGRDRASVRFELDDKILAAKNVAVPKGGAKPATSYVAPAAVEEARSPAAVGSSMNGAPAAAAAGAAAAPAGAAAAPAPPEDNWPSYDNVKPFWG